MAQRTWLRNPTRTEVGTATAGSADLARRESAGRDLRVTSWAIAAVLVLTLLLIFVVQNDADVPVRFLAFDGNLPLGVALLAAAAAGAFVVLATFLGRALTRRLGHR